MEDLTPLGHWRSQLARLLGGLGRREADRRTRAALPWWDGGEDCFRAQNLSGACLLVPAAARAALGGTLLDERYPLYFEDNDLCRRLTAAGRELWAVPAARVVHHWARSSGIGTAREAEVHRRYLVSRGLWLERWFGPLAVRLVEAADAVVAGWPEAERGRELFEHVDLGQVDLFEARGEVEFDLGRGAGPWLLELALTPHFALAAGSLGEGSRVRIGPGCFEWLFPGRYWARVLARDTLAPLAAFSFVKTGPARTRALNPDELFAGERDPREEAA